MIVAQPVFEVWTLFCHDLLKHISVSSVSSNVAAFIDSVATDLRQSLTITLNLLHLAGVLSRVNKEHRNLPALQTVTS